MEAKILVSWERLESQMRERRRRAERKKRMHSILSREHLTHI
jgi:hypothetical protein